MPKPTSNSSSSGRKYKSVVQGLKDIYLNKIRPLEELINFDRFYFPPLTEAELDAKPTVLLLGQYSTGKTTFITNLLGAPYPGAHIGPEPTTDKFVAVMHGSDERVIPGNAAAVQSDKPFKMLTQFGSTFLTKFQVSSAPIDLLEDVTFVDSPGVLSGEKQTLGRSYDFVHVCEWFAEKADMILLLFDANKLDISDEFKRVITALRSHDDKIRVVLNKVDMITNQQLMRVYGALMWSLGKVIHTPEVVRVYVGSHWSAAESTHTDNKNLINMEMKDLLEDLYTLPRYSAIRKVNDLVKRCRLARVHAHLLATLRNEMPSVFGKSSKQAELIHRMPTIFTKVQKMTNLPPGDFPDIEKFKNGLAEMDFTKLPKLSQRLMDKLQQALNEDLPRLMLEFPPEPTITPPLVLNPFDDVSGGRILSDEEEIQEDMPTDVLRADRVSTSLPAGQYKDMSENDIPWAIGVQESDRYERIFHNTNFGSKKSANGIIGTLSVDKMSGHAARKILQNSKLPVADLKAIWTLADTDKDGGLDIDEFKIAMKLVDVRINGGPIPAMLPDALILSAKNRHER